MPPGNLIMSCLVRIIESFLSFSINIRGVVTNDAFDKTNGKVDRQAAIF
ncbi:hypothetical protein HMPREF9404_4572 [Eggerthella sp. HGA1]|nr:hypothetical protein HMPREF9404_4572 [Eggerthella sp. HGA1]